MMSTRMVINTETVVGYNNKIMQATADIKLAINNDVNTETKKWGFVSWTEVRQKLTRQTAILRIQSTRH